jgi:energy-coupling factor transport system permease protein
MRDTFSTFHPVVNFVYFTAVILFGMFFLHPVLLGISIISAYIYSVMLKGRKAVKFNMFCLFPVLLLTAVMNPAFNHQGETILFYLKNGNPVTLESILYGIAAACMLITVILWFSCYNAVMTSDKFIYLFGRIIPASSLILSMVLRFVPRYTEQIKVISNAQKCIGRDVSQGNIIRMAGNGIKILSVMTTWALENTIETADSMKSRGYGMPKRTSFSLFRFDRRDKTVLAAVIVLIATVLAGAAAGQNTIRFFPSVKAAKVTFLSAIVYFAYFLLCMLPVSVNIVEDIKWKHIESRI